MKMTRRTFLKASGTAAAATGLLGTSRYFSETPFAWAAEETHVHNVCGVCSGGCATLIKVVDGVALELAGNPYDQAARGKLCVKGHGGLGYYKNPGRLTQPLMRTNPKKGLNEDPGFVAITWAEALTLMADKMKEAIAEAGPESIAWVMRPAPDLIKRFVTALGTPNHITHITTCYSTEEVAWAATVRDEDNRARYKSYVENTHYTLSGKDLTAVAAEGGMGGQAIVVSYESGGEKRVEAFKFKDELPETKTLAAAPDSGNVTVCSQPGGLKGRNWTRDIARSSYILGFGFDMPGKAKNMMAQDFLYAVNNGTKAVIFDPRFSETAVAAVAAGGEWIPIKPGTDLAVVLAMLKYIVDHELQNDGYVEDGTTGFAELRAHFTSGAGKDYTLAWAEEKSGVPAATIERITKEFTNNGAYAGKGVHTDDWVPCIFTHKRDAGGPNYAGSWRTIQAITAINALVGSIDRLGGEVDEKKHSVAGIDWACPAPPYPPKKQARLDGAERFPLIYAFNKGAYQHLFKAIVDEDPYPIKFLFFRKYNLLSIPGAQAEQIEALNKVFVTVADIQSSESVWMADLVLPEVNYLEGRSFNQRSYFALYPQIAAQLPGPKVSGDAKGFRWMLPELAKAFGDWKNAAGYTMQDYFRMNPGGEFDPNGPLLESKTLDDAYLKKLGKDLGDAALEAGGWDYLASLPEGLYPPPEAALSVPVDPRSYKPSYGPGGKKVALYSTIFEDFGADPLPVWQASARPTSAAYPLQLITTRPAQHIHSSTQDLVNNKEMAPTNAVWINPADAAGIRSGDRAKVENQFGRSIELPALVTHRVMPGVVCVPHGFGHFSKLLKNAYGIGGSNGELVQPFTIAEAVANGDPTQGAQMQDVYVKVTLA